MSKILRRPMFRKGGSISSDGVGITSGLHDMRSRYEDPIDAPVGSFADRFKQAMEQTNANEDAKWNALKSDKSYDLMDLFKSNPTTKVSTTSMPTRGEDILSYDESGSPIVYAQNPNYTGESRSKLLRTIGIPDSQALYESLHKKEIEENLKKNKKIEDTSLTSNLKSNLSPEKTGLDKYDVGALYEKYLGSVNRPNQDLYDRLKYMELAKFGLGLLTPAKAGESNKLLPAIGRAGVPAVTGLETIAEMQNKEDLGNRDIALKMAIAQSQEAKYREETNRWLIQQRQQQIDTTSSNLGKTFDPKTYPTDEIAKKFVELQDRTKDQNGLSKFTTKDLQPLPKNYETMNLQDKLKYKDYILVDQGGHFWTLQSGIFKRI